MSRHCGDLPYLWSTKLHIFTDYDTFLQLWKPANPTLFPILVYSHSSARMSYFISFSHWRLKPHGLSNYLCMDWENILYCAPACFLESSPHPPGISVLLITEDFCLHWSSYAQILNPNGPNWANHLTILNPIYTNLEFSSQQFRSSGHKNGLLYKGIRDIWVANFREVYIKSA